MDIRKALLVKSLREFLIITACLSFSNKRKPQISEIRMSINLPYVEGTSEKLRRILRSHKIRSTFYTENALRKLLCKPKDRVATEDKNNIVYEISVQVRIFPLHMCDIVIYGGKRGIRSSTMEQ